ncbi:MAG TPA: efflux RND transporter periplasmic adaptor subunit [Phycisphaerae bacterium]|nr:efflux RND transporter periplasmic adaptor subunit [Phycisphaerae bacterium]
MLRNRGQSCWRTLVLGSAAIGAVTVLSGCREPDPAKGSAEPPAAATKPASPATQGTTEAPVQPTVDVRRETLRQYAPAVGSFRARQSTRIGPQVTGRVQEVLVNVGDIVSKGQVLLRLDPSFFQIDVEQNKAAVDAAQAALANAAVDVADSEREMNRRLELFGRDAGSTKERDDAIAARDRAIANHAEKAAKLAEAKRKLDYAQQQLDETRIRAPFDGAITARLVDPGETAALMPPTQLVEIQEVGVLYLEFSLPQELLDVVGAGTPMEFEVEGVKNGGGSGMVAVVFPAIDAATRSFRCRAIIENQDRKYQPGLLAQVKVVTREVKDALVVPRTALSQTASGWQTVVAVDGRPVTRPVDIGLITDDWAEVLGGLAEGDRVVAKANGRS